ncbi:MAG TPA: response regulator transcription factor [Candidatus Dormibacteraeota bacterium]|jgi:DNA-binding response OmpR family regulator|nr:response regulator transcription factor [Candidatus Dormibacteraeota bacterium]
MGKQKLQSRSRPRARLPRILVVDANGGYRSVISHVVELTGGEFESVADFDAARRQLDRSTKYDLVILGMSAESRVTPKQLGELRTAARSPFILLDESSTDAGQTLETFEAGASQVLPKPFVPDALIGAIKSELRGPDVASVVSIATKIELGGLVFDANQRTVMDGVGTASLTKREWQLLSFFLTNPNQFFAAEDVALPAWGPDASIEQFRTYVTRLRQKLLPFKGVCEVVNEKGKGYRLVIQQPKASAR